MTTKFARSGRRGPQAIAAAAILATALTFAQQAFAADVIVVRLDQARVARLPDRVATLVVGNPLIADVSLQQGGLMVLTGKGYGTTNLIALDRAGKLLSEQQIQVQGPIEGIVVVYRGTDRESYSCTPRCERRITLGDSSEFFDSTIAQTTTRNQRAAGSAGPAAGAGAGARSTSNQGTGSGPPGEQPAQR